MIYAALMLATGLATAWRVHHGDALGAAVFLAAYIAALVGLGMDVWRGQ